MSLDSKSACKFGPVYDYECDCVFEFVFATKEEFVPKKGVKRRLNDVTRPTVQISKKTKHS